MKQLTSEGYGMRRRSAEPINRYGSKNVRTGAVYKGNFHWTTAPLDW